MKLSTISAICVALGGTGLALGSIIEPSTNDESTNSTEAASELIDSLVWRDVDGYVGDKVPGDNFLNLCAGDHSDDIVNIDRVNLIPNPPVRGQQLTVDAAGTIRSTVNAGTKVLVKVKLGPTTVYKKNFDLCKEIEKIGGRCPISSGKPKIVKTFTVPKAVPRGIYSAFVNVVESDGSPITCLEGKFKL